MILSPDTEIVIQAINDIFGRSLVPEDLHAAVSHSISELEKESIVTCVGKSFDFKAGYLIGYAAAIKKGT